MDPRRAKDPRLARADPRLAARGHSGSPAPTPPPQAFPQYPPPTPAYNGAPSYGSSSYLPQHSTQSMEAAHTMSTGGSSTHQLTTASTSYQQPPQPPLPLYKSQMLFCVVCASNQVRFSTFCPNAHSEERAESLYGSPQYPCVCT